LEKNSSMSKKVVFEIKNARNNVPTAQAKIDDKPAIYLHSMVDPYQEAKEWLKRIELLPNTLYVVLGAGLGYHLEALLAQLPYNSYVVLLYAKDEIQLLKYTSERLKSKWLSDPRLSFLELVPIFDMAVIVANRMLSKEVKKIQLCRHFPTMGLAETEYQVIEEELVQEVEKTMAINFNVKFYTDYDFFKNFWKNSPSIVASYGAKSLEGMFTDIPVIIVASGPSLDKNIQELKKCVNKAIIIAAGTAIGALHKHGIKPHILMVTDATEVMYEVIKDFFSQETLLVTATTAQHQIVTHYPGPKCFVKTSSSFDKEFMEYFPNIIEIRQTVSVATAAVDFANYCGARTIILVGQDLAYSAEKQHAVGVQAASYESLARVQIPGYFGGQVDSNQTFIAIIDYYNEYVKQTPHIRFINATEGGAMISTMSNLSLEMVHQHLLTKELEVDKIIRLCLEGKNTINEYQNIFNYLYKMRSRCEKLANMINKVCTKNNIIFNNIEINIDESKVNIFDMLYDKIVNHTAYKYVQPAIEMRLTLLKFQILDEMHIDLKYHYYQKMTLALQEVISELISWIDNSINEIKQSTQR